MLSFRYAISFITLLAALTGCSEQRRLVQEKYTGERHGDPVGGNRRVPVLNPGYAKAKLPTVPVTPIIPTSPQKAKGELTPYEQYDGKGNDATRTNVLKELFLNKEPAPVSSPLSPAPVAASSSSPSSQRKPFKGSSAAMEPADPVDLAPDKPPEHLIRPTPPVKEATPLVNSAPAPAVTEEENGVFISDLPPTKKSTKRSKRYHKKRAALSPAFQLAQAEPVKPYPHLADVPKTPPEFTSMKKEKAAAEKALQMQHDSAMEQKQLLGEEPTELTPATPAAPAEDAPKV